MVVSLSEIGTLKNHIGLGQGEAIMAMNPLDIQRGIKGTLLDILLELRERSRLEICICESSVYS